MAMCSMLLSPFPSSSRCVRANISTGLRYLESWLGGRGCVPINNLMEDAATAEISRAQLWQWARHGVLLQDGQRVTAEMLKELISAEVLRLSEQSSDAEGTARFSLAGRLFERMAAGREFTEFLTLPAYEELVALEGGAQ